MIEFISLLPREYQEVEYLENSGTQYIVVDLIPNQNTRLDMLVEPRSIAAAASGVGFIPYGSGVNNSSNAFECYTNDGGKLEFNYDGQYKLDLLTVSVGTKINISHNKNNILVTNTNGQTIASHSFNYTAFTCPRNLALFAINRSTALAGQTRIYSCQIYNDTTLAFDLVPCYRKADNVAGLYDLVNNVFYTNAGSGVFAVGANSNKHATATITPGGVISFGAALRRRMMVRSRLLSFEYTGNYTDNRDENGIGIVRFTSSGTLTVLSGTAMVSAYILGAGGGGAINVGASYTAAASGGGGGYQTVEVDLVPGTYEIVIGLGGNAKKGTGAAGNGGDTVAFGITSTGGKGGYAAGSAAASVAGAGGSPNGNAGSKGGLAYSDTLSGGSPNGGSCAVSTVNSGGNGYVEITFS